jgi:hypothetical protein
VRGPVQHPNIERERYRRTERDGGEGGFMWPRRTVVDIENMARDAFTRFDDIHNEAINDGDNAAMDDNNVEGDDQWNEVNLENLVRESTQCVTEGSTQNRLQCSIVLYCILSAVYILYPILS